MEGVGSEVWWIVYSVLCILLIVIWRLEYLDNDSESTAHILSNIRTSRERKGGERQGIQCPICLFPLEYACETSCGHAFCGNCFLQLVRASRTTIVKCPMDRQSVTCVVPSLTLRNQMDSDANPRERNVIDKSLQEYNFRAQWNLDSFLRAFGAWTSSSLSIPNRWNPILLSRSTIIHIISWLYILSPIDLLPEAVFGPLGYLDDLLILLYILYRMSR